MRGDVSLQPPVAKPLVQCLRGDQRVPASVCQASQVGRQSVASSMDSDDEVLAVRVRRKCPELVIPPPPAATHTGEGGGAKRKGGGGDEPGAKKPRAPEAKAKKPAPSGGGMAADSAKKAKKRSADDDEEAEMKAMMEPKKGVRQGCQAYALPAPAQPDTKGQCVARADLPLNVSGEEGVGHAGALRRHVSASVRAARCQAPVRRGGGGPVARGGGGALVGLRPKLRLAATAAAAGCGGPLHSLRYSGLTPTPRPQPCLP